MGYQYAISNYDGWLVTIRRETLDESLAPYLYQLRKETYGTILETINNKNVVSMEETFHIMEADGFEFTMPEIPDAITIR